jgi:GntR family transcriptional regulator
VLGITQMLRDADGAPTSRLLAFAIEPATAGIAGRLAVGAGEPIVTLRRLRLVGGRPFSLETSYLPRMAVPGLSVEDLADGSLYRVLGERYGIQPTRADETIGLSRASPREAEALELDADAPVLLLRAVVFDQRDQPVEYLVSVNHPDRVEFGSTSRVAAVRA